jgi:S-adenosylmethionine:tRNA ribosyltransferase-isomerase
MVFNDTKVVPARLHFQRETGAHIEIFCLEPVLPEEYVTMFEVTDRCRWKCIVGNVKRWKSDTLFLYNPENDITVAEMGLKADLVERRGETSIVEFSWTNGAPFSKVLEICGSIPIPPYLNRETEDVDLERYQTLYAKYRGSVAAPTAGLHFTERVLDSIAAKGIEIENVCLHVGAGTFLPVKSSLVSEHTMHREPFVVTRSFLTKLISRKGKLIAVGTTSVRTLESLYYVGVKCIEKGCPGDVCQWEPYERKYEYTFEDSIQAILDYMERYSLDNIQLGTSIIIVPGYEFKVVDVLVTNFHQPQSTLLLLISAFVKGDWKNIYDFALENDFRFLSYGDSSLLFRQ